MTKSWSKKDLDYLRDNYKTLSYAEIGETLGKSASAVKSKSAVIGIRVTRSWPIEHVEVLKRDYAIRAAPAIAAELGRSVSSVYGMAKKLGLKKSDDWYQREESGRTNLLKGTQSRFEKGLTPWNKGTKTGPAHPNTKKTQFKKGQKPHNTLPIGSIVHPDGYLKIKIAEPNVWVFYQRHVWEKHHGPIPVGCLVRFRDGDPMNCEIDNLMLETPTEHCLRNSKHKFPEEVIPAMAMLADLKKEVLNAQEKQDGRSA